MENETMAMRTWIEMNLDVTTATLPRDVARRLLHLQMRDYEIFYSLIIYGYVARLQQDAGECFPEHEFLHYCGEFVHKLQMVLTGRGTEYCLPMFLLVGRKNKRDALLKSIKDPASMLKMQQKCTEEVSHE